MMLTIALFAITGFAALVVWVLGYAPLYVPMIIYITLAVIVLSAIAHEILKGDEE